MALIVFLRGVNVGGHRRFRPSSLVKELSDYDVVNVGAAGTFVVRKGASQTKFRAELARRLPFSAEIVLCNSRDLLQIETDNPFASKSFGPDTVRFVSILSKAGGARAAVPISLPHGEKEWLVRLIGAKERFVFGVYRRHMRTIGCLGQIDRLFGTTATTRNWNTILAIIQILKAEKSKSKRETVNKARKNRKQ
jgi:uncharacterized protein (DUF1697 family)